MPVIRVASHSSLFGQNHFSLWKWNPGEVGSAPFDWPAAIARVPNFPTNRKQKAIPICRQKKNPQSLRTVVDRMSEELAEVIGAEVQRRVNAALETLRVEMKSALAITGTRSSGASTITSSARVDQRRGGPHLPGSWLQQSRRRPAQSLVLQGPRAQALGRGDEVDRRAQQEGRGQAAHQGHRRSDRPAALEESEDAPHARHELPRRGLHQPLARTAHRIHLRHAPRPAHARGAARRPRAVQAAHAGQAGGAGAGASLPPAPVPPIVRKAEAAEA